MRTRLPVVAAVLAMSLALAACTTGAGGGSASRHASAEATLGPAPDRVLLGVGPVTVAGTAVLASFPATGGKESVVATVDGLFGLAPDDQFVALSPDGRRVAYLKAPGLHPPHAVVIADLATGAKTTVYRGFPEALLWAGERLLVETAYASRTVSVREADADGGTTDTTYALPSGTKPFPRGFIRLLGGDERATYFGLLTGGDPYTSAHLASVWRGDRETAALSLLRNLDAAQPTGSFGQPVSIARPALPPRRAAAGLLPLLVTSPPVFHRAPPDVVAAAEAEAVTPTIVVYRLADMSVELSYAIPGPRGSSRVRPPARVFDVSPDGLHYLSSRETSAAEVLVDIDGPSSAVTTLPMPDGASGPVSAWYADGRGDVVFKTWTSGVRRYDVYFYRRGFPAAPLLATQTPRWDGDFLEVVGAYRSR